MNFYKTYFAALFTLLLLINVAPITVLAPENERGVLADVNIVAFVPSRICLNFSHVTVDKPEIFIDLNEESKLPVTLRDCSNNPLAGLKIYVTSRRGSEDLIYETSEDGYLYKMGDGRGLATISDANGRAYFDVTSTSTGSTAIYVTADNVVAFNEVPLTFSLSPAAPPVIEEEEPAPAPQPEVPVISPEVPSEPGRTPTPIYQRPRIPKEKIFISEEITEVLLQIPEPVAYSIPYLLFILLVLLGLLFLWQVRNETRQAKEILGFIAVRKLISDEKQNFLSLVSHYLRTPLTLLKGYVDGAVKYLDQNIFGRLASTTDTLDKYIAQILKNIEDNEFLKTLTSPDMAKEKLRKYLSPHIIIPIFAITALGVLANYIFHKIGKLEISATNLIMQILAAILAIQFLLLAYRRKKNAAANLKYLGETMNYEEAVDEARNRFVREIEEGLSNKVGEIKSVRSLLTASGDEDIAYLDEALGRMGSITSKLEILGALESGLLKRSKQQINLVYLIRVILEGKSALIEEKNIKLELKFPGQEAFIESSEQLLKLAVGSVVDNAIKFSNTEGKVTIRIMEQKNLIIEIKDEGAGMTKGEMLHLFRPFARTTSATDFNHEGIGLGLYLTKIILESLGGNVVISSKPKKGTTARIILPRD
jgi:signal transduction histidine kinase